VKGAVPTEHIGPGLAPSAGQPDAVSTALGGLIAIAAGLGIGRFVYTPILPPMIKALGLTKSQAGLIASANFAGYLIGALLAAMPGLAGSRRLWVLGALATSGGTTGAMGLTHSLLAFLVLRALGGAASAFVLIFSSTIVLDRLAVVGRSGLSALYFAGVGSGIALSAALVAELLRLGQSWESLWLVSGGLTIAALLAAAALLPDSIAPTADRGTRANSASDRALQRLVIAYGLFGFGYVITATFLVAIVRAMPTIRTIEPVIWVVFGIAAVPSVALWTRIGCATRHPDSLRSRLCCRGRRCPRKRHLAKHTRRLRRGDPRRRDIHGADRAWADGGARPHDRRSAPHHRTHDGRIRCRPNRGPALRRDPIGSPRKLYHTVDRRSTCPRHRRRACRYVTANTTR
jgi:hypothetical protein